MAATSLEGQHIDSGPDEVQLTFTNVDAAKSIYFHEIFGKTTDSGKLIAAVIKAGTDVATIGTVAVGEVCQIAIKGRFRVPKSTSVSFTQGQSAYWDAGNDEATTNAIAGGADDFALGMVVKSASTSQAFVTVDINFGPDSYDIGT